MLQYAITRPEAANTDDFPVFGNEQAGAPERSSRYELHLPYTIVLRLGWGGERGMVYFFASRPASADRCVGYLVIGRNYNLDQSDRVLQEFEDTIFGQDQVVVESQRPERVPFDLAAEPAAELSGVGVPGHPAGCRGLRRARPPVCRRGSSRVTAVEQPTLVAHRIASAFGHRQFAGVGRRR